MTVRVLSLETWGSSVVAVPPLARDPDLNLVDAQNLRLLRYLERGGVTVVLYGGNANLYDVRPSEYARLVSFLAGAPAPGTIAIPSVGPSFGLMMDQADVLRDHDFATAMVLPTSGPSTVPGAARAIEAFAGRLGRPALLYLKRSSFLDVATVARLHRDGAICAVKYAIQEAEPGRDRFLERLCEQVDPRVVVSGMGERPALDHMRSYGLAGFTSGSVCVAPRLATRMLRALVAGEWSEATALREAFLALEDLRDRLGPIRVLHDAVTLCGLADMGTMLPMQQGLEPEERAQVSPAVRALLGREDQLRTTATSASAGSLSP